MNQRSADRFEPTSSDHTPVEDADDTKPFGNDDAEMPTMPGHPASSAAAESPEAQAERARDFGMDSPQDSESENGGGPFNLDAVNTLRQHRRIGTEGNR